MSTEESGGPEQRRRPRFLCDERFSDSEILPENTSDWIAVNLINYNRYGVCIFMPLPLEALTNFSLRMAFDDATLHMPQLQIPCELVYRNDSDIGSYCGVRFRLNNKQPSNTLIKIEEILEDSQQDEDRYGLLDDADL